jgi:membrane protease subunit HflK
MPWNDKSGNNGPWGSGGGGPWGGGGNRGGNNGSGGGRGPGGRGPNDFEELLRRGQDRLKNVLPGGFFSRRGIILGLIVVILLWLASGFYRVQTYQKGLELIFGVYQRETGEGLNYNFPAPIGSVEIVDVTNQRQVRLGFDGQSGVRVNAAQQRERGSLMLTGDENIIDIQFVVFWLVKDARLFQFNIRNPEEAVKSASEAAMREVIGKSDLQFALTQGRQQIEDETRKLIQRTLDSYGAGIAVMNVQMQSVNPPLQVIEAFNNVQTARQDKERAINDANAYKNELIPKAKGDATRIVQQAEAYKAEVVNRAQGDAQRFISVYDQYVLAKDITVRRLYIETLEQVLRGANKVVLDKGAGGGPGGSGVLPYLPLPSLRPLPTPPSPPAAASSTGGQR